MTQPHRATFKFTFTMLSPDGESIATPYKCNGIADAFYRVNTLAMALVDAQRPEPLESTKQQQLAALVRVYLDLLAHAVASPDIKHHATGATLETTGFQIWMQIET